MSENGNDKKTIGLYAVILFTSAFIVLLLTAYSQMKFSKSANEYENLISSQEKAKINFKTNLNSALEENKKLESELSDIKEALDKLESENELYKKKLDQTTEKGEKALNLYKLLIEAQSLYINDEWVDCAMLLRNKIDPSLLDSVTMSVYQELIGKAYDKAAKRLYETGRKAYGRKDYTTAKDAFLKAVSLEVEQYFMDDCYYYLAYSEYRLGNMKEVEKRVQELLLKYPSSKYKKDAQNLLELTR